jgi:hypothetical protein
MLGQPRTSNITSYAGVSYKAESIERPTYLPSLSSDIDSQRHAFSKKNRMLPTCGFFAQCSFPEQMNGVALWNQWRDCEDYNMQVSSLLEKYLWYKENLDPPILLCEIARRCTW